MQISMLCYMSCTARRESPLFSKRWGSRDQRLSSKRPSRPKKWPKLSTPRWAPVHDPHALPSPSKTRHKQTLSMRIARARAFQKEKTSCQGRPMKAHALPCLKPLMICTLPRSPYARQHDAMRCCCHAHGPRYCLPLLPHHCYHSASTALLCKTTACCVYADDATLLLLPRCCYPAILASNTPIHRDSPRV
jgi:hypothetical protein